MKSSGVRFLRSLAMVGMLTFVVLALSDVAQASCGNYLHTRYSSPTRGSASRLIEFSQGRAFNHGVMAIDHSMIWNDQVPAPHGPLQNLPCNGPGCRQHPVPLSTPPLAVTAGPQLREADCFTARDSASERSLLYLCCDRSPVRALAGHPEPIEIPPEA
ncbi:MAG: hypothetical protein U0996_00175 [Planctomycetaceae bacterium]